MAQDPRKYSFRIVHLSAKFDGVLYPVDLIRLARVLPTKGWIVPTKDRDAEGGINLEHPIAKGDVQLIFSRQNLTLGTQGTDPKEVVAQYRELMSVAKECGDAATVARLAYTELIARGFVEAATNPLTAFQEFWTGFEGYQALAQDVAKFMPNAKDVSPYGVRLALGGQDPNQNEWCEFGMVPAPGMAPSWFSFDIVYRRSDSQLVEAATEKLQDAVASYLSHIEHRP